MAEVRLTRKARSQLWDIWDYTAAAWGEKQADEYVRRIHSALMRLADAPLPGIARPEIQAGYRALPIAQHVIFYTVTDDAAFVDIIGILHARMDIPRHLP